MVQSNEVGLLTRSGIVVGLAAILVACVPGERIAERVLADFVEAVQAEDLDRLYCLLAGASEVEPGADPDQARADFDRWAVSRYMAYEAARDRGGGELEDHGVVLVKTFALGKGTYYRIERVRPLDAGLAVETVVNFGYTQVNYSTLSPGTTFYLAGAPAGRVVAVRIPQERKDVSEEVLESLRVRWELARVPATAVCPEGWAVASVAPVAGSETTSTVTWRF